MAEVSKTVGKACEVLEQLSSAYGGLALSQLARRTGSSKPALLRLLATLAQYGLVESDSAGRYELGPAVVNLARARLRNKPLFAEVLPVLRELVAATGCTGYLGQLTGGGAMVMHMEMGSQPVVVMAQPGQVYPAHSVAFGLAILAELPDEQLRSDYAAYRFSGRGKARDLAGLLDQVAAVRSRGYAEAAVVYEGMHAYAIALPTSSGLSGLSLSVAVSGLSEERVAQREAEIVDALQKAKQSWRIKGGA